MCVRSIIYLNERVDPETKYNRGMCRGRYVCSFKTVMNGAYVLIKEHREKTTLTSVLYIFYEIIRLGDERLDRNGLRKYCGWLEIRRNFFWTVWQ